MNPAVRTPAARAGFGEGGPMASLGAGDRNAGGIARTDGLGRMLRPTNPGRLPRQPRGE